MIELQLTQALAVYSVILAVLVGAVWLYTELSVKRPQRHLGRQFLWRCSFCGCTYLDERAEQLSRCPRCASYNTAEEATGTGPRPSAAREAAEPQADPGRNTSRRKRRGRHRGPRRRGR